MGSLPVVLVYEFISGGSRPAGEASTHLKAEALGMLWAALADFQRWGAVQTVTLLDPGLEGCLPSLNRATLPADRVILLEEDPQAAFFRWLGECDAALIIAPETGGALARLNAAVEPAGVRLLGAHPAAVIATGDKAECARRFQAAGLPTPQTETTTREQVRAAAQAFGFPLVIKPRDGVGCDGVSLVTGPADLEPALERLHDPDEPILLQRYICGVHASVSLLATEGRARALSLNGQRIEAGVPFTYRGGSVPLEHRLRQRAFEVAEAAAAAVPGLQGYVGIDFVLTEDEAWIIEINPRLTTSYLGLRQVLPLNLMEAVWDACSIGVLPEPPPLTGQVSFEAHQPETWLKRPEPAVLQPEAGGARQEAR